MNEKKTQASFSLVFKVLKISPEEIVELTNLQLGKSLVQKILNNSILSYQPNTTVYNRLQIRVADENQKVIAEFKYDIPYKKGRIASTDEVGDFIKGRYTCRFSKEDSRSQWILRIRNFIGPPTQSYWIDDVLTQPLSLDVNPTTLQIQLCGLTLNRVYDNLYEEWDEIVEKITP